MKIILDFLAKLKTKPEPAAAIADAIAAALNQSHC